MSNSGVLTPDLLKVLPSAVLPFPSPRCQADHAKTRAEPQNQDGSGTAATVARKVPVDPKSVMSIGPPLVWSASPLAGLPQYCIDTSSYWGN
jgi:hypothetical protein